MPSPFDGLDQAEIETFGEAAIGNDLPVFWPGSSEELECDGIVSQTTPEGTVPGTVTRLFVRLVDLSRAPERKEEVQVRGTLFAVDDIVTDDIGGMSLVLRKK